jgi:hypothetical protein
MASRRKRVAGAEPNLLMRLEGDDVDASAPARDPLVDVRTRRVYEALGAEPCFAWELLDKHGVLEDLRAWRALERLADAGLVVKHEAPGRGVQWSRAT